jgi:hypothetical protein
VIPYLDTQSLVSSGAVCSANALRSFEGYAEGVVRHSPGLPRSGLCPTIQHGEAVPESSRGSSSARPPGNATPPSASRRDARRSSHEPRQVTPSFTMRAPQRFWHPSRVQLSPKVSGGLANARPATFWHGFAVLDPLQQSTRSNWRAKPAQRLPWVNSGAGLQTLKGASTPRNPFGVRGIRSCVPG